jgi:hypothetical protein
VTPASLIVGAGLHLPPPPYEKPLGPMKVLLGEPFEKLVFWGSSQVTVGLLRTGKTEMAHAFEG